MNIDPDILRALGFVAIAGAVGGVLGGFLGSSRASVILSALFGAVGGVTLAAILRLTELPAFIDAGEGFSLVYGVAGGFVLGLVVSASNKPS